jgi:hypothetical protein
MSRHLPRHRPTHGAARAIFELGPGLKGHKLESRAESCAEKKFAVRDDTKTQLPHGPPEVSLTLVGRFSFSISDSQQSVDGGSPRR